MFNARGQPFRQEIFMEAQPAQPAKPTREYTVKDVLWRLRDQLQLRAVLAPTTGRYHSKAEIPARALSIRKRWRRALARLRKRGLDVLADRKKVYRSARDCPLTFVMVYGKPRSCKLYACPFCWARQAAEWWDDIDAAFFKDAVVEDTSHIRGVRTGRAVELDDAPSPRKSRRMRAHRYSLVVRVRTFDVGTYRKRPDGLRDDLLREFYLARLKGAPFLGKSCAWFARVPEINAGMAAIAREGYRSGCFENITADFAPGRNHWRVSVRQVWMVPEGAKLPPMERQVDVTYRESTVERPWRTDVMKAVAQACRYPKAMLSKHGGGAPEFQLVVARQGLRLAARYGHFRCKRRRGQGE